MSKKTLTGLLARLKRGRSLRPPRDPETLPELLTRMARKGFVAELRPEAYDGLKRRFPPLLKLLLHSVISDELPRCHLVWFDIERKRHFGRTLTEEEAFELTLWCELPKLQEYFMSRTGFGTFPVHELRPRERFVTLQHRRQGQVIDDQADDEGRVIVWLDHESLTPRREALPRETEVRARTPAEAFRIRRRLARSRGRQPVSAPCRPIQKGSSAMPQTKTKREPQQTETNGGTNRPVHEIRMGRVKAAIWVTQTEAGPRHNVTFCRLYKTDDSDAWQTSTSFGRDDLPLLKRVAELAFDWIYQPLG